MKGQGDGGPRAGPIETIHNETEQYCPIMHVILVNIIQRASSYHILFGTKYKKSEQNC